MSTVFADAFYYFALVVMEREGIPEALTGDHHFEQAGFRALLR